MSLREPYPAIEPYRSELVDVGDGHRIHVEECGNPRGKPVVFLHGGPGGGCSPLHRRLFDPERYRIVLLDQRGCGRSLPHVAEPEADLSAITTWHLVADLETVRTRLGIERWQVFGGSWGSTLALAYAQAHPGRVTELVLRGIFTVRASELRWTYQEGADQIRPERWADFLAPIPPEERGDLIEAYHRRLADPDPAVHQPAAAAWTTWEMSIIRLLDDPEALAAATEPRAAMAVARIENHVFRHRAWLEEGQLIARADRLAGIPAVIVQGRYDTICPPVTAWDLHRAWPGSELIMVPDAGHAVDEPGILDALVLTTDRFAAS